MSRLKDINILEQSMHEFATMWNHELVDLYDATMNMMSSVGRMETIIDTFNDSFENVLSKIKSDIDGEINLYKTLGNTDSYAISFKNMVDYHISAGDYLFNIFNVDPKNNQVFTESQVAIVDTKSGLLTPAIAGQTDYAPVSNTIKTDSNTVNTVANNSDFEEEYDYYIVSNDPSSKNIIIESVLDTSISANMIDLDLTSDGKIKIIGADYYDETTSSWLSIPVNNMYNDTYRLFFAQLDNIRTVRIHLSLSPSRATARTTAGLNRGILTNILQDPSYFDYISSQINQKVNLNTYTYLFRLHIDGIKISLITYEDISHYVIPPYKIDKLNTLSLKADTIQETSGAIEFYIGIADYNDEADDEPLNISIIPIPPDDISALSDMIEYPQISNRQFITMFPIDTNKTYALTLDGNPVDQSTYTIDYNIVTLNNVDAGRYAFSYTPIFIDDYKLYTIKKADLPIITETHDTTDGDIDEINSTITFTLEKQIDANTLTVIKTFNDNDETVVSTDITVESNKVTISSFENNNPVYINATYTFTYQEPIVSYASEHIYYYGPKNHLFVSNDNAQKACKTDISYRMIYPIIIFRDTNNQPNKFSGVHKIQLFFN